MRLLRRRGVQSMSTCGDLLRFELSCLFRFGSAPTSRYWRPAAFNATSCDKELHKQGIGIGRSESEEQAVTTFADCSWGYEPNGATRHGIIWQLLGRMTLMTAITDPCDILQPTGSGASGQSEERMEEADEVQEGRPCSCRFMRHAAIASFIFAIFLWKVKKSDEL